MGEEIPHLRQTIFRKEYHLDVEEKDRNILLQSSYF